MRQPGAFLVGLYAWTVTMAFGAVLVDVVHASQVPGSSPVDRSEVGDFLLVLAALTLLAASAAIAASWDWRPARYLLVASLVVVVVGLVTPIVLSGMIGDAETALGVRVGPWMRLGEAGLASVLAFVGLREAWREPRAR